MNLFELIWILDRIDLVIDVPRLKKGEYFKNHTFQVESSSMIKRRVLKARSFQKGRYKNDITNARLPISEIKKWCSINKESQNIIEKRGEKDHLSSRVFEKLLKVARTIADLEGSNKIETSHIMEAIHFRKVNFG